MCYSAEKENLFGGILGHFLGLFPPNSLPFSVFRFLFLVTPRWNTQIETSQNWSRVKSTREIGDGRVSYFIGTFTFSSICCACYDLSSPLFLFFTHWPSPSTDSWIKFIPKSEKVGVGVNCDSVTFSKKLFCFTPIL